MVPWEGLEPSIPRGNAILSRARIPFRHHGICASYLFHGAKKRKKRYSVISMQEFSTFIFDSYDFNPEDRTINLRYSLDGDTNFIETITLPEEMPINAEHPDLDKALFALHLMGGISYYKTCLPKTIQILSGALSPAAAMFWNDVYENGLGEFFYKNDIDFRGLIRFPSVEIKDSTPPSPNPQVPSPTPASWLGGKFPGHSVLVPIGGGKDSVVTMEMLKNTGFEVTLLRIGQHPLIDATAATARLPLWNVKRGLSKKLFEMNAEGALNGHVPITGYLSCLSVVIAILSGRTDIAFSNEASANIGNVEFHGKQINHQWSKSLAFEKMFQEYIEKFITGDVRYFSLLRTFSELKITEMFCLYPKYFPVTTSCNTNWKIVKTPQPRRAAAGDSITQEHPFPGAALWCGVCPKCAFVFAMMGAFLPKEKVLTIFGKNLFADEMLLPLYRELLGLEGFKPFECVGTPEETTAAFLLAHNKGEYEGDAVMKMFIDEVLPEDTEPDEMIGEALMPNKEHSIPKDFQYLLI